MEKKENNYPLEELLVSESWAGSHFFHWYKAIQDFAKKKIKTVPLKHNN